MYLQPFSAQISRAIFGLIFLWFSVDEVVRAMVYRGALNAPWPCHAGGSSTVPAADRAQVDRLIEALQVIYEPQSETAHLVQAIRESAPPRQIYKMLKALFESISWDPNGAQTISPTDISPGATSSSQPKAYRAAPNTHRAARRPTVHQRHQHTEYQQNPKTSSYCMGSHCRRLAAPATQPRPQTLSHSHRPHPGVGEDFRPGTPPISTWPAMRNRRIERRGWYTGVISCQIRCPRGCGRACARPCVPFVRPHASHECTECHRQVAEARAQLAPQVLAGTDADEAN